VNATADQQLVKRINRSVVLRLLFKKTGLSRAQLAAEIGLTKSTVSLLVRELIDEGWLTETHTLPAVGMGRPSTPLHIDTRSRGLVGVEIAVEVVRVVAVSLVGEVAFTLEERLQSNDPDLVCHQTARMVSLAVADLQSRGVALTGIGVGVPGAVDAASGQVRFAPNLGWRNVDVLQKLRAALRQADVPEVPVQVQNEADTAALSEYEFPEHDADDSLIFVTCDIGVGAGIVLNDRLFTGAQGMAGEIGHSVLQIDGPLCSCGRKGCAEAFIGARALGRLTDPSQGGPYLGVLLQNLWTTFDPSAIVVGGPSCTAYPGMVEEARATLQSYARSAGMVAPQVRSARFGMLAAAVGAAALVLHEYLRPMQKHALRPTLAVRPDVFNVPSADQHHVPWH
jgi:predicted NBD/HSP70 family sugar kinase